MSEPSYFDDGKQALKLKTEALEWIGTPFQEYYQQEFEEAKGTVPEEHLVLKGVNGAGVDCIGLSQEIFAATGALPKFIFKREPADYEGHGIGDKILDWMRGKLDDPQSKRLGELLTELVIPKEVLDPHGETPRDFFKPGDILVMQHGSLFHMPIIYDNDLHFVNALPRLGVIEGTIQDSTYSTHLVAAFRIKPK